MTIYDIAKAAGVSVSTVSRVINGKKNIKESTREKVQKILDENGYIPNAVAQGLSNNSMKLVGIMAEDIRNVHHSATAYAIERECSKLGYSCNLCNMGDDRERQENYIRLMAMRQVDGLIFLGSPFQNEFIEKMIKKYHPQTPVVIANGYLPLKNVSGILCDDRSGVRQSVEYLTAKGHTEIGFIQNYDNYSSEQKRLGYQEGLALSGLPADDRNIIKSICSIEGGKNATEELMKRNPRITAIIYGEDISAVGGVKKLGELGYEVPKDVEVIGFDNSIYTEISTPTLTSVDNKLEITGTTAARTLCDMIEEEPVAPKTVLSQEIIFRQSTATTKKGVLFMQKEE